MQSFKLTASDGRPYQVAMPDSNSDYSSAYVFAFHKSGSTLIQSMLQDYCSVIGVPTFSLFDSVFRQGISTEFVQGDARVCLNKPGYIFTGFRHFPRFEFDMRDRKAILLVRDPRDMLVSLYYSIKTSHPIPSADVKFKRQRQDALEINIDEFVLKRRGLFYNAFKEYMTALSGSDLTIYRYEDVVYRKEEWLRDLVKNLSLKEIDSEIKSVATRSDIIPKAENEAKHIRQVHPGNHKKKLGKKTVDFLNDYFKDFMSEFGYEK